MKALKEKRISLRSLWRRGLVILSLFALVFASCSSDSGSSSDDSGGKRVYDIVFPAELEAFQYVGQLVDLTGLEVTVKYAGSTAPVKIPYKGNENKFSADPKVVSGLYNNTNQDFYGMPGAFVYYDAGGGNILADFIPFKYPAVGIKRENTTTDTPDLITNPASITRPTEVFTSALHLTGNLKKNIYFVDDDTFDFTGLTLEAEYDDNSKLPISFSNVTWSIVPDYNRNGDGLPRNLDDEQTYMGYVYITVGEVIRPSRYVDYTDPNTPPIDYTNSNSATFSPLVAYFGGNNQGGINNVQWNGGVTTRQILQKVYTVKERDGGIEWAPKPELEDFFFWMENTPAAWTQRLIDAGAQIRIHYRGTTETKTLSIAQLAADELIYWNLNKADNGEFDCGVTPLKYPFTKAALKTNGAPQIKVNYRGGVTTLDVDVFSVYRGVTAVSADGTVIAPDIEDPDPGYDNDIDLPYGSDEAYFASKIKVTATYRAYNNTDVQKDIDLKLWPSTLGTATYNATSGLWSTNPNSPLATVAANANEYWKETPKYGPYYTTNFLQVHKEIQERSNAGLLKNKWPQKGTILVNYATDSVDVENYLRGLAGAGSPYAPATANYIYTLQTYAKSVAGVNKKFKVSWNKAL